MTKQPDRRAVADWTEVPDVVAELDLEGRFVYISRVLPGITEADVIGSHVLEWVPADYHDTVRAAMESVRQTGQATTYEIPSYVRGEEHWWVTRVGPISVKGELTGFLLINIDVTALQSARMELEASRQFITRITSATPDIMYVLDLSERKLVYTNQTGRDFVGYGEEEVESLGSELLARILHPEDVVRLDELFARWDEIKGNEVLETEIRLQHRDRSWRRFLVRERAFTRDGAGRVTQIIGIAHDATERIAMEKQLAESERKYRQIVEMTHDGIAVIDAEGKTVFVNPRMSEMLGHTAAEMLGRSMFEFVSEQSYASVLERFKRRKKGISESYELALRRKDGSELWCHLSATPLKDEEGKFSGALGVLKDMTQQRQAQQAEAEARRNLEATLNAIPDLLFEVDADGVIHDYRAPRPELLFVPPSEFLGKPVSDVLPPEAAAVVMAALVEAEATGKSTGYTYSLSSGGKVMWFDLSAAAKETRGANKKRFVVLIRDITERKQQELKLREMTNRFEALSEQSPNMIFIHRAGKVYYANRRCEEVMEYSKEELYAADFDFYRLMAPESLPQVKEAFERHQQGENVPPCECVLLTRNGDRLEAIISTRLLEIDREQAILGVVTDVTELMQVQRRLRDASRQLKNDKQRLQEKNIALKQILSHLEQEQRQYQRHIMDQIRAEVMPILDEIKGSVTSSRSARIAALQEGLEALLSHGTENLQERLASLSPRELEVAKLIRMGLSSKEIADRLNRSVVTIHKHREQIRRKLAITNRNINLATFLRTQ